MLSGRCRVATPERMAENQRRVEASDRALLARLQRRRELGLPLANPPIWVRAQQEYRKSVNEAAKRGRFWPDTLSDPS